MINGHSLCSNLYTLLQTSYVCFIAASKSYRPLN